jgi:hypothetical protein
VKLVANLTAIVLDKLVLGCLLAAFAAWFARTLDRSKGRESFSAEISKERVRRIGVVWDQLSQLETLILHVPWRYGAILWQESRKAGIPGLPSQPPSKASELGSLLATLQDRELPIFALTRINDELPPLLLEINAELEKTSKVITGSRFWLGEELHERCRAHYNALSAALREFNPQSDLGGLHHRIATLDDTRENVVGLLPKIDPYLPRR